MTEMNEDLESAFPTSGPWTAPQLKLAFHLYCETPFGKLHSKNRSIIALAQLIGRSPDAVAMKLSNFASLDPHIRESGRSGLRGASALDRQVWDAFHADWAGLSVECEALRRKLWTSRIQQGNETLLPAAEFDRDDYSGETRQALVEQRIKQSFFRRAVLASYRGRCCVSGVTDSRFLVASHIVPWRLDKANRLNPSNGLCLTTIHDKAFDQYLFSLTDDHRVILSSQLKGTNDAFLREVFWPIDDRPIELPDRFQPDTEFVRHHRQSMLGDAA